MVVRYNYRALAKVDGIQMKCVIRLRKRGASVKITSGIGKGFPDLVVGYKGHNLLMEVKNGALDKAHRKLNDDQEKFHQDWRGQIVTVLSEEAAEHQLDKIDQMLRAC